jgi:hypothetical protein
VAVAPGACATWLFFCYVSFSAFFIISASKNINVKQCSISPPNFEDIGTKIWSEYHSLLMDIISIMH